MPIESLSSPNNTKIRMWMECLKSKGIRDNGLCVLSGEKLVREVLKRSPMQVSALVGFDEESLKLLNPPREQRCFVIPKVPFNDLDELGTHTPLAIVRAPELKEFNPSEAPQGFELVIPFSDPGNIGACIRSAAAFGISKVILTQEAANPFLPRALRSSAGQSLRLQCYKGPSLSEFAASAGVYALDMEGVNLNEWSKTRPANVRVIVGEEGQGLPSSLGSISRISIPMKNGVESLNAAVAASLVMNASL